MNLFFFNLLIPLEIVKVGYEAYEEHLMYRQSALWEGELEEQLVLALEMAEKD